MVTDVDRRSKGPNGPFVAVAYHGPMPRTSAGILLFRRSGTRRLEVLLGHPGGPYFDRRDAGVWSIPKGEADPGEDLLAVARREFAEETGSPAPDGPVIALGSVIGRSGKVIHAWAIEGDLDPVLAVSNEFSLEWPPGSGRVRSFPEIDRVAWFSPGDARRYIGPAQVAFIDRLEAELRDA